MLRFLHEIFVSCHMSLHVRTIIRMTAAQWIQINILIIDKRHILEFICHTGYTRNTEKVDNCVKRRRRRGKCNMCIPFYYHFFKISIMFKLYYWVGLSVKNSRCRHLQKIIVNWLVSLLSLLRQQSLLLIDYIYFNKSKSYAWDMQAKLKERKIILENFAALRKER